MNNKYKLVNTETKKILKRSINLSLRESKIFNYAFALNGKKLKYIDNCN